MALNDPLGNVLSHLYNCDKIGKPEIFIKNASKLITNVLQIIKDKGYIGEFTIVKESKGNITKINLLGNINRCGVIKPRLSFEVNDLDKFERRFLPSKDFGFLIVSTSKGLMVHDDARKINLGGRLMAYVY